MKKMIVLMLLVAVTGSVFGQWSVEESKDLMAGTVDVLLINIAVEEQGALNDPFLVIKKVEGKYMVFIHWGGYSLDRDTKFIVGRFGDIDADAIDVSLSTSNESTFLKDPDTFVKEMLQQEVFVAMTILAVQRRVVAAWDVSGLEDVIGELD